MKHSKPILIVTILFSIIIFISGQLFSTRIFEFFEPKIDGITFQIIELNRKLKTSVFLSLILALIPISIFLTWRLGSITSLTRKLISALIILLFIVTGIWFRRQVIKSFFTSVVKKIILSNANRSVKYPLDPVACVYFMFAGLCIGCLVAYFLFRTKNKKMNMNG